MVRLGGLRKMREGLEDLMADYQAWINVEARARRSRSESQTELVAELTMRIDQTFELHLRSITDAGVWWLYPQAKVRHSLAVIRLTRFRLGLSKRPDALLSEVMAYVSEMPAWM
jgi:hypothetical protein